MVEEKITTAIITNALDDRTKIRGFEKITIAKNNDDIHLPKRMTIHSAGYDFVSPISIIIPKQQFATIPLGIKAYFQPDEVLLIYSRSGLATKQGIRLRNATAVIDSDYYNNEHNEGEICIILENSSDKDFEVTKGMRIAQGVFQKILFADDDSEQVKKQSRQGGLGST